MNQTKKRLTIINLAISMTDMDTIQLQISKLALLKSDLKIVEILSALNGQSYGQAQRLISEYIDAPNETVLQRTTQDDIPNEEEKQTSQQEVDEATIDEFELFTTPSYETSQSFQEEVNYDAFLDTTTETQTPIKEINYDPLLNVEADDVLANNIDIDITQKHEENLTSEESITNDKIDVSNETKDNNLDTEEDYDSSYEAIPHINNKFNNLYTQYPPIEHTQSRYYSVENWLLQVSTKGYTEAEVETRIKDAEKLKHTNLGESAQLLIAAGATDSPYALFQLARALFIGDILQKNIPEAVTLIHYLAINEEYPEAICDLAQFYEQGIEVEKDKKKAEALYKQAMHLGIQRAKKHYQRIQKENKSFFSIFKK
ncbi:MAG TPA: hypothetical protein EYG82_04480 [Sulfurovum sp.]|nr:hypothetical protein [Sulfurovum sp.]